MDKPLSAALAKRLAAYSATAGVVLAVAPVADAQIVYHDIIPDLITCSYEFLDVDGDGDDEIMIDASCYNRYSVFRARLRRQGDPKNGFLGYRSFPSSYSYSASRLVTGEIVGPTGPDGGFYPSVLLASASSAPGYPGGGPFHDAEGYAGFRFVGGDGQLHYGWLRLSVPYWPLSITTYEYAYESSPDTPIVVGDRGVLLSGHLNQTSFPPEGGTLRYTLTATNTSGEPLPLDLWIDHYRQGHGPGRTRLLGSGTLPVGATVTRTVMVTVPAGAPAGDYDVTFALGDFAEERALASESFVVTKEAAEVRGERGADLFTAAPPVSDLFATAGAAAVEIAGTHALSAPAPNPTDGRTAFTLAVAEGQHVAVAVHDALGRVVARLHDGPLAAGEAHRLVFDGSELPAGVYVVRAVGEAFADTRVLTLMR